MKTAIFTGLLVVAAAIGTPSFAGQAPGAASEPDVPVSHHDRVYAAEQFSNTVGDGSRGQQASRRHPLG